MSRGGKGSTNRTFIVSLSAALLATFIIATYVVIRVILEGRRVMPSSGDEWGAWGTWVGSLGTIGALVYAARQFKLQRKAQERSEIGRLRSMEERAGALIAHIGVLEFSGPDGEGVRKGFTSVANLSGAIFRDVSFTLAPDEARHLESAVVYKEGGAPQVMSATQVQNGVRSRILRPGEAFKVEWIFGKNDHISRWDWGGAWVPEVEELPADMQTGPNTLYSKSLTAGRVVHLTYRDNDGALWRREPGDEGKPELLSL